VKYLICFSAVLFSINSFAGQFETALAKILLSKSYNSMSAKIGSDFVFLDARLDSISNSATKKSAAYTISYTRYEVDALCTVTAECDPNRVEETLVFGPLQCK
jgi:hypothetical protein